MKCEAAFIELHSDLSRKKDGICYIGMEKNGPTFRKPGKNSLNFEQLRHKIHLGIFEQPVPNLFKYKLHFWDFWINTLLILRG